MEFQLQRRFVRLLIWSVAAAVGIYGVAIVLVRPDEFLLGLSSISVQTWLVCLLMLLCSYALRFARWHSYLVSLGYRPALSKSLGCYLAGFAFSTTPGKAGEAIRSIYMKDIGIGYRPSLAALFTERFLDVLTLIALSAIAVLEFESARLPVVVVAAISAMLIPIIHNLSYHILYFSRSDISRSTKGNRVPRNRVVEDICDVVARHESDFRPGRRYCRVGV